MTDEVYRPQRKKINPAEFQPEASPEAVDNQAKLDKMAEIRRQIAENPDIPNMPMSASNLPADSDVKITGSVPPAFDEARRRLQRQNASQQQPFQQQNPQNPKQNIPREVDYSIRNNPLLEELLNGTQSIADEVMLPSMGKFYDGNDGPTDGFIKIRPMTGAEEEILATPRHVKNGEAMNMIFNRCLIGGYKSENLLTEDRTLLLIYLRGISYNPIYEAEIKCPACQRKSNISIDLNSLLINECPDNFGPENLSDRLPTSGYLFSYNLSRGADELKVLKYREKRNKEFNLSNQNDDTTLYRSVMLLNEIRKEGSEQGLTDKQSLLTLLRKLSINDVNYIRNCINSPPFGVDTKIEMLCPNCGEEFSVDLPLEADFFFPRTRKETPA